jgi:hypothetical protein
VAPNAVVVGDVDLFERVRGRCASPKAQPYLQPPCGHSQLNLASGSMVLHKWQESRAYGGSWLQQASPHEGSLLLLCLRWVARPVTLATLVPPPTQTSIWYGCVLRGDLNSVRVGAFSNVQDRTVIHAAR